MRLWKKTAIGSRMVAAGLMHRRHPLIVAWSLTKRCNLRCLYCGTFRKWHQELATTDILRLIDEMSYAGVRMLSFTGGEPLLHEDIGLIIRHCRLRGISTAMNSNGTLIGDRIRDLRELDRIKISLDGGREIHDRIRGPGVFNRVMESIPLAQRSGIKVSFLAVISRDNVARLGEILGIAAEFRTTVSFQPATLQVLDGRPTNPISPNDTALYKNAIRRLLEEKSRNPCIGNSVPVLRHLLSWPEGKPIRCAGRMVSCRIEPDGRVYHCGRVKLNGPDNNALHRGFKKAFESLTPQECTQCWCTHRLEMNYICQLHPLAIINGLSL